MNAYIQDILEINILARPLFWLVVMLIALFTLMSNQRCINNIKKLNPNADLSEQGGINSVRAFGNLLMYGGMLMVIATIPQVSQKEQQIFSATCIIIVAAALTFVVTKRIIKKL